MSAGRLGRLSSCPLLILACALAEPAYAVINFDPDGSGPLAPVTFAEVDLLPGNILR